MTPVRLDEADTHSFTLTLPATSRPPEQATSRWGSVVAAAGWTLVGAIGLVLIASVLVSIGAVGVLIMVALAGYVPVPVTGVALAVLVCSPLVAAWVHDRRGDQASQPRRGRR